MKAAGPILIAGGGIAGLTAALAFARHGFTVEVYERVARLEKAGAGIQLSPNATRILFALGLRDTLLAVASQPEAVRLIDAKRLRQLARVPLGAWGEGRWGAPYLTCRRADLQRVLLDAVRADARIALRTDAPAVDVEISTGRVSLLFESGAPASGALLVGADGVHSALRRSLLDRQHRIAGMTGKEIAVTRLPVASEAAEPKITGLTAWRAVARRGAPSSASNILHPNQVSTFLKPEAHLVAYPTGGEHFNLVAFAATRGEPGSPGDAAAFRAAFSNAAPVLQQIVDEAEWSAWPLLTVSKTLPWTFGSHAALIGDAAHAMTPFAAQGAAMAIEDAFTLAAAYASPGTSLTRWEEQRRARMGRVIQRGRLNRLTWHAGGAIALARNLVLRLLSPQRLARDLDWLYGWQPG